ncbi:MAG: orotidine-5'-phosphate decarboxylase [Propionibacteriaceae bacterium]
MLPFRTRLETITQQRGRLCVGIDPHPHLLSSWQLPTTAQGAETMARSLVEALGDLVAVFKPQSAFFECYGSAGIVALERTLADIRQRGALSILDAKRGDIGSTSEAYAAAYLAEGAPLSADALTVNPYLGVGSLHPFIDAAHANGRGLYLLCRTSNKEGGDVQLASQAGRSVAQYVVDEAVWHNTRSGQHALGLVIGATHSGLDIDLSHFKGSILAPGVGAQGGTMDGVSALFGAQAPHVLPSTSRAVIAAGPDHASLRTQVHAILHPGR